MKGGEKMNGLVAMMPTAQSQPIMNNANVKSPSGQGFKNAYDSASSRHSSQSIEQKNQTMSESEVKSIVEKVQEELQSEDGDITKVVESLSDEDTTKLLNTINQLMGQSNSFMNQLNVDDLNALGKLLLETHNQMTNLDPSNQSQSLGKLLDSLKQLQSKSDVDLSQLSKKDLSNLIESTDNLSLEQLGLSLEKFKSLVSELDQVNLESLNEDSLQQILESIQQQEVSQLLMNAPAINLQQIDSLTTGNQNQVQQTEQALARVIASLFGQQQNMTFNQQSGSSNKWQQLLQQLQQQINQQNLNQPSVQHRQDVAAIRQSLTQLLNNQTSDQSMSAARLDQLFGDQNQMSKLEQFTIHLARANGQQSTSNMSSQQQMIEQLQRIIQSSNFGRANGAQNLTIQLKPANLGQMTLQFMQIDGQMGVKISVMSQAAREMLESNINQLRHMFQPNQVVIEQRSVDQANTDFTKQHMNDEQAEQEEQEGQLFEEDQLGDIEEEEIEQPLSFQDFLVSEEVE